MDARSGHGQPLYELSLYSYNLCEEVKSTSKEITRFIKLPTFNESMSRIIDLKGHYFPYVHIRSQCLIFNCIKWTKVLKPVQLVVS